jgi:hypothetical protein
MRPLFSAFRSARFFALAFIAGSLWTADPVLAQTPADDPYGIGTPSTPSAPTPIPQAVPDTAKPPTSRTDTIQTQTVAPDTVRKAPVPRTRVTRETTVNPMDVHRGSYRNPKKALFMSLVVPGLGQAYIGQSKFNYIRAAAYFTADVTMGYLWYQFSVVKYDRKVKQYRGYADQHWSQRSYENKILEIGTVSQVYFEQLNPNRISYCASVQENSTVTGQDQYAGCIEPYSSNTDVQQSYTNFVTSISGEVPGAVTAARRAGFPDHVSFYEMIGADQEFLFGWDDINDNNASVGPDTSWVGASATRDNYNTMRQTAKDYSRMQTWFLGGIVLNHIASAVDAAITARRHNRVLYEDGGARWYDKINVDGGMAMDQGRPRTHMMAYLSF